MAIEKQIIRSMTHKLSSENFETSHCSNLIIPKHIKSKLKRIASIILQSIVLSQSESSFWNSFSNSEKSYILTSNSQCSLDFTSYQEANFLAESEFEVKEVQPQIVQKPQNLYFDLPTSSGDSDNSDDQELKPVLNLPQHLIGSDESFSASLLGLIQSNITPPDLAIPRESPDSLETRGSSPKNAESFNNSDNSDIEVPTAPRGRPLGAKNKLGSWKNTAAPA
jgi:hypothetical protein